MIAKRDTWGVIYCPTEGGWRSKRRWQRMVSYLERSGQPFDFVRSEGEGGVERLAAMLTENGYGTILVVGGDAALGDALNGIISATPPGMDYPALGVVPNGLINDFANFWGLRSKAPEAALERLLHGRTMRVDVGEVRMMTLTGEALRRYFLNCVNVGLVADVVKQTRRNHSLWRGMRLLRDLTSALMLMIARPAARMEYRINGQSYSRVHTAFCIGSATGFGQTPSAVPYNGQFDVSAVKRPTLLHVFTALSLLLNRRFLSQKGISVWRTPAVEISHVGGARVSVDGHAIHRRIASLEAEIHPSMIRFLIP